MKLSQLTTEQAINTLCELTPYIANLTGDKALLDELGQKIGAKGKSTAEIYVYGAKKISTLMPLVLKDHKTDVFGILSILNETTPEAIGKQNVLKTLMQIREAVQDRELMDFFKSWGQPVNE